MFKVACLEHKVNFPPETILQCGMQIITAFLSCSCVDAIRVQMYRCFHSNGIGSLFPFSVTLQFYLLVERP